MIPLTICIQGLYSAEPGIRFRHFDTASIYPSVFDEGQFLVRMTPVIVVGENLPAVDATCARIMEIDPANVPHLAKASGRLGPIREVHIAQRGERIRRVQTQFELLDKIGAHQGIRLQL